MLWIEHATLNLTWPVPLQKKSRFHFYLKNLHFRQKASYLTESFIFSKTFIFDRKLHFWQKAAFLTESFIFDNKLHFLLKKPSFLTESLIFDRKLHFFQESSFLTKIYNWQKNVLLTESFKFDNRLLFLQKAFLNKNELQQMHLTILVFRELKIGSGGGILYKNTRGRGLIFG